MPDLLQAELGSAKAWITQAALPFWSGPGFDRDLDLFVERVDFSGRPLEVPRRLMVQARQIAVFSQATLLGWFDGRDLVDRALRSTLAKFANGQPRAPWAFSVDPDGSIGDATADSYGYAFLLFALAWARRLLGPRVDAASVAQLIAVLRNDLAHGSGLGVVDAAPRRDGFSRQNPQMHLLEAALEAAGAFADAEARQLCDDIVTLFETRLFSHRHLALAELYDDNWQIADLPHAVFEPGHHFEWIWLLDRVSRATGRPTAALIGKLQQRAFAEGIGGGGAIVESIAIEGPARAESRRCWATCEALKAVASDYESGRDPALATSRATALLRALRICFLSGPFDGGWIDRIDGDGRPLLDYVPASTLYHVVFAVAEADRVFGGER
ncbi:mannose-6-phosphate isomerase [Rhodopseudomonas rhenobacensis]|uniref:Mannose-6-phosphate isomerase n=1 Tax=Rhodopseudomonas rhenobacensis TaxID=87461 RepID=A0A7W7Z5P5_9BRAD|nr:AGE family epimerase/isomerase [Rhodopseudomonas rhenobacensis]MBB5048502.1 mannose-6-phosphate isomerase [Rhodopseudomonas rhenobacensis]